MAGVDGFFDDGYVADAMVRQVEDVNGALIPLRTPLAITYRPMGVVAMNRYFSKTAAAKTNEEAAEIQVKAISEHLVSWDRQDRNGEAVLISVESCRQMSAPMSNRLFQIISGRGEPDEGGIDLDKETKN